MRTVDPAVWSGRRAKRALRRRRFGRRDGVEASARAALRDALREHAAHAGLRGVNYLTRISSSKPIRYIYALSILGLVLCGLLVVVYLNFDFQSRPLLQLNQQEHTIDTIIPFPAVAICSNCLISKKGLNTYFSVLPRIHRYEFFKELILNNLDNFGSLVTFTRKDLNMQFMKLIYTMYPEFNVTDLMYMVAPKCSDMLKRCWWRGQRMECDKVFAARATPLGFCCVFNARYQPDDIKTPPMVLDLAGQNLGLAVVVTENPEDFAVVRRLSRGFDVLVFDGTEYPLLEGGAARMYPVTHNTSAYFALTARAQFPGAHLRSYNENWRGCRVKQPQGRRGARSSYSWCLTQCRRSATAALCNCLPFTLLPNRTDTVCTPEHLYCLNKHKEKLAYYFPGEGAEAGRDSAARSSQRCAQCAPDCARALHAAAPRQPTHYYPEKLVQDTVTSGPTLTNASMVRFYYMTIRHQVFSVEVDFRWYEAFATLGCQTKFLTGFSLVAVSELVYYCTIRWAHHFLRRRRMFRLLQK